MRELPPKLFFRIGEVAGLVGVEPHVLRYWEREFRSIRPTKSAKGQRVYSRKDVENLLRVRDLLYRDGFTIAGARKRLLRGDVTAAERSGAPSASVHVHAGAAAYGAPVSEEGEARAAPPAAPARASAEAQRPGSRVRERLLALRDEVEAFLDELGATSP